MDQPPNYKIPTHNVEAADIDACYNTACMATHIMQPKLIGQVLANWPDRVMRTAGHTGLQVPTVRSCGLRWDIAPWVRLRTGRFRYRGAVSLSGPTKGYGGWRAVSSYYRDLMIAVYEVAPNTETLEASETTRVLLGTSRISSITKITDTVAAEDLNFFGLGSTADTPSTFNLNIEYGLGMNQNTPLVALSVKTQSSPFGARFSSGTKKVFRIIDPSTCGQLPYHVTFEIQLQGCR